MIDTNAQGRSLRGDIVFVFALGLACYLAWQLRDVLVVLYVSALFAVVFAPVVQAVSKVQLGKWRPFKGIAVLVLPLAIVGILVAFGFAALPPVIHDLQEFSKEVPSRTLALLDRVRQIPFADRIHPNDVIAHVQDVVSGAATQTLISIKDWAGKLFSVVMGVILTVYFILEGDHAYRWFLSFFPPQNRERLDLTLQRAEVRMGKWLLGQGSLMLILGISSTIVYLILGVRYAYALGALAGMLNVIPIIGATVSIVLALLVAAIDSWGRVLGVAIFFAIYLQVENSLLVPRIMKSRVGLPGLAILVALLLGSSLAGVVGALVSVPTAVLVAELVDQYLVNKGSARGTQ
ncbi:MAG: AI-2E family transporter [Terracidiphilus sp.]